RKLEQSCPQGVEDTEADPVVVAQLGEIGRLEVLPGTPASSVVIPSQVSPRIALRSSPMLQQPAVETHLATEFGRPDLAAAAGVGAPRGPAPARSAASVATSSPATARDEPATPGTAPVGDATPPPAAPPPGAPPTP